MPPSPREILDGLGAIANAWRSLAIAWHVALGALLIAVFLGWRPGKRLTGMLSAIPMASVSVLAWMGGNPFNGAVFAAVTAALAAVALGLPRTPVRIGSGWLAISGGALVAFGWVYPHFLETDSWTAYLYAAPMGLIPCPTLSAVVGVALVLGGMGSLGWSLILAASAVVYGLIGSLRLGVTIDLVLVVGGFLLALAVVFGRGRVSGE